MKRQTQEIESVKSRIHLDSQKSLELLRRQIDEQRENLALRRDRINASYGATLRSLAEVELVTRIVQPRTFEASKWLDATSKLYRATAEIETNIGLLVLLGAVPEDSFADTWTFAVRWKFDRVLGHLHLKDQSFRDEFPGSPDFSPAKFNDAYSELFKAKDELKHAVMRCLSIVLSTALE